MKSKKLLLVFLLICTVSSFIFCQEKEEKSTLDLGIEVAELKFELYKIENKLGDYKEESDFSLSFEKAKKERMLRQRNQELLESVEGDKEKAKKAIDKAMDSLKSLKEKSLDFLNYIKEYFEEDES